MKLLVIGIGQCGGRIADEFARLNKMAQTQRGIEVVTGAFAVNTDMADLSGLHRIRPDYRHRILIGDRKTGGHGVGKINELAAAVAREDGDKVIDSVRVTKGFQETDAFLLIAGAAGGTGSGAIGVLSRQLKESFADKPVYNLVVLPFAHEEVTEERTVYNAATCLKSAYLVADAVILVDNQRYVNRDSALRTNLNRINAQITQPFYNLLCAGEEKRARYIGAKLLDAGDIIQTLAGWTTVGHARWHFSLFQSLFRQPSDFRKKAATGQKDLQAMDQAITRLALRCQPAEAKRALYLVSAAAKDLNVDMVRELGIHLKTMAPAAIIRSGDYPRPSGSLEVSVILSELRDVPKVRSYFTKALALISNIKKRQEGLETERIQIDLTLRDIPSLL